MTTIDPSYRRRRRRRRVWPRIVAALALVLAVAAVFLAGYGLGRAIDDNPDPGPPATTVSTLRPLPAVTTPVTTGG